MTEPRALLVAPATPARTGNGLAMRLGLFQDALARVADVDTLVLPVSGPLPDENFSSAFGKPARSMPVAGRVDTQFMLLSRIADPQQRLAAFERYGRGSRHAALSLPVLSDMRRLTGGRHYHLAHIARLYLAEAAGQVDASFTSLDLDEDDAWAWRTLAATQTGTEAAWSMLEAEAEDRLLERSGPGLNALFVSGPNDLSSLAERHPGLTFDLVPNALEFPAAPARRDDGRTVLFVGAFGYQPNVDGVLWFVQEVWPAICAGSSDLPRLRLVGRDPPAAVRALASAQWQVEVVGPVEGITDAYATATLAIAPLHAGAGTRLKLIEAAAHGVPVVTTALAARGLDFVGPRTAWVADTATDFAKSVRVALADPAERLHRAGLARELARPAHDRELVVDRLARRFAIMLQEGASARVKL